LCESPAHSINCPTSNSFESKKFISIFLLCVRPDKVRRGFFG
jgi:hypothetical protein